MDSLMWLYWMIILINITFFTYLGSWCFWWYAGQRSAAFWAICHQVQDATLTCLLSLRKDIITIRRAYLSRSQRHHFHQDHVRPLRSRLSRRGLPDQDHRTDRILALVLDQLQRDQHPVAAILLQDQDRPQRSPIILDNPLATMEIVFHRMWVKKEEKKNKFFHCIKIQRIQTTK